jgi:hypothetical protein
MFIKLFVVTNILFYWEYDKLTSKKVRLAITPHETDQCHFQQTYIDKMNVIPFYKYCPLDFMVILLNNSNIPYSRISKTLRLIKL